MKKNLIFVANWKMKLNFDEELRFVADNYEDFLSLSKTPDTQIVLCPSFLGLYPISQIFKETDILIGAQNCSKHLNGAFTGQVSAESFNFLDCKYCIIGHSESRKYFNETNSDILQKLSNLIYCKISPILCIGESDAELESGKIFEVLGTQLEELFKKINDLNIPEYLPINIAYEPIWSIGTGKIATLDHLETVFSWLYNQVQKASTEVNWQLLYGGSVDLKNILQLKKIENLNGFLIGGSSLNFKEFEKIVKLNNT